MKRHLDHRQHDMFKPDARWTVPTEFPEFLKDVPFFSLDTETKDPKLKELGPSWFRGGGHVVGFSLAWTGGSAYFPIRHEGGDNMPDAGLALAFLKNLVENYTGTLILMNGLYDLGWLRAEGIRPLRPELKYWDVGWTEALLDEYRTRYNLNSIAVAHGLEPKDEKLLAEAAYSFGCDPKADLWRLPARYVGPYAQRDAELPLIIYEKQKLLVDQQGLGTVHELEHSLTPLLQEMRWRGVRVDVVGAERLFNEFNLEYETHVKEIKRITGLPVDVWSADSVAVAFKEQGVQYPMTGSGKPSFTDEWLKGNPSEVAKHVSLARKAHKAGHTFCKNMVLEHADKNGRVHTEFHPLRSDEGGTVSGRFSSSGPNLQQVPARDPRMNTLIRGLFLPEEGELWCAADYSQQEPRLTVHYAVTRNCTKAEYVQQRYINEPGLSYHNLVAEMLYGSNFDKKQYRSAKDINLGLAYGMGGAKLCKKLGYQTKMIERRNGQLIEVAGDEGQAVIDRYNEEVPYVRELSGHYAGIAADTGAIRTLSGRLCRFPFWEPWGGGRMLPYEQAVEAYGQGKIRRARTHVALNRKIQGGSADMIKIALRNMWREGLVPLVTVHDENGISVKNKEEARKVVEIMRDCVKLKVPLKVDVDLGPSWGTAKPMTEEELDD